MAIETEKKYRLTKPQMDQVQADLEEFNAEFVGEDFEENILFGNEMLKIKQALLRIRRIGDKTILAYKQFVPNTSGVKHHIEYETTVASAEILENIIENLDLEKRIVYEKRRRTWKFKQVEVVLDELPFGLYMEIEGSLMGIAEAEMFIGADEFELEPRTYPFLVRELGKRVQNRFESRFGNNNEVV